jgi:muconolactone delta-isomerase
VSDSDELVGQQRPLAVVLEARLERRIRVYADRLNRRIAPPDNDDLFDVDNDDDLAATVMLLCEIALENDERRSGLAAHPVTGELCSRELADEHRRRQVDTSRQSRRPR